MSHTITSVAVSALLALGGCSTKTEGPSPTASTTAGSATTPTSDSVAGSAAGSAQTGSGAAGSGDNAATEIDVPTKVDFEDEASAKITDKNVEAQVQAMEKQLEQK